MLIRRALLLAAIVVLVSAGPAYANHTYEHVLETTLVPPTTGVTPTTGVSPGNGGQSPSDGGTRVLGATFSNPSESATASGGPSGSLARTGASDIVSWIQAAVVLMGSGALLVLGARRRRTRLA